MSHYASLSFSAKINSFALEFLQKVEKEFSFEKITEQYPEHKFLENFKYKIYLTLFSEHKDYNIKTGGWQLDLENKILDVNIYYKLSGFNLTLIDHLSITLPYLIDQEFVELKYADEHGDWKERVYKIYKTDFPEPDYFRNFGD